MPRLEKTTMQLACNLTEAEVRDYAEKMADAARRIQAEKGKLKSASAQIKSDIAMAEATLMNCSEKVNSKQEFRSVEVKIEYDFPKMEKTFIRQDNFEIVKVCKITQDELQEEITVSPNVVDVSARES